MTARMERMGIVRLIRAVCVAASLAGGGSFAKEPSPAGQRPAAEVRIEYPFDDAGWKESFEAIARHLVAIDETLICPEPFLGRKPFVVRRSRDGMPRASVGQREYIVFVCPVKNWYAQFAYQMGHELGHYWIGPNSTSQFQESVCTALSFIAMDELARQWEAPSASPKQAAWGRDLRNYHAWVTFKPQLDKLGLKSVDEAMVWARSNGPKLLSAWDRDHEQVMAKVIERVLRRHPGQWAALKQLGNVAKQTEAGMFARWADLVTPQQYPLVQNLATAFGVPIGPRPSGPGKNTATHGTAAPRGAQSRPAG